MATVTLHHLLFEFHYKTYRILCVLLLGDRRRANEMSLFQSVISAHFGQICCRKFCASLILGIYVFTLRLF